MIQKWFKYIGEYGTMPRFGLMQQWGKLVGVVLCLVLSCLSCAGALDFNDLMQLKQNHVAEDVIITIVQQSGGLALSLDEESQLRAAGASATLIAALLAIPVTSPKLNPTDLAPDPSLADSISYVAEIMTGTDAASGAPVTPLSIVDDEILPPRYDKQGWFSVSNTDTMTYYTTIDSKKKRIFISKSPNGGDELPPGSNRVFNTRKESYKLYGENGRDLKVKVRENEVTRMTLIPFGVVGNSGLTGVVRDSDDTRTEKLFDNYVPPPTVVIKPAPVIVIPETPPPVIVIPDPHQYYRSYHRRYYDW